MLSISLCGIEPVPRKRTNRWATPNITQPQKTRLGLLAAINGHPARPWTWILPGANPVHRFLKPYHLANIRSVNYLAPSPLDLALFKVQSCALGGIFQGGVPSPRLGKKPANSQRLS